jgi:hypothetical protein
VSNSDLSQTSLNDCGCCKPEAVPTPIYNRPGLSTLSYRAGTYATFFRRMLTRLGVYTLPDGDFAGTRPLLSLTTRDSDDPSIALLDASAIVSDILTFYQERIANEGFLRTATERRSILELARAIGYELNPGVAASAYLAFTVEDALGAPGVATIPAGAKVQSVPPDNQLPQTFETSSDIVAYAAWNSLHPRMSQPQNVTVGVNEIYLSGTGSNLRVGDVVLATSTVNSAAAHILKVEVDSVNKTTHVILENSLSPLGGVPVSVSVSVIVWGDQKIPFNADAIRQEILQKTWNDSDLNAFLKANDWNAKALVDYVNNHRASSPVTTGYVFALRTRLGIFGNNAPKYDSLPASQRLGSWGYFDSASSTTPVFDSAVYPNNWDDVYIGVDSVGTAYDGADFFLERVISSVMEGGYFALESKDIGLQGYGVKSVIERSLSDFGMSAKATGIKANDFSDLSGYKVRNTTAYVQSEQLMLTEIPIKTDLSAGTTQLEMDEFVFGLQIGQPVILTGERADAKGLIQSEALIIKEINHNHGLTTLTFETGLSSPYKRDTVKINANVTLATNGVTATEILGAGNGAQPNQQFTLKKPPLTYTTAPTPSGSISTLQLRVNNLLWSESPSLYGLGPNDQNYTVRIDDDGKPTILFGDGVKGARLPTGINNVVVTYRSGIGLAGEVAAESLTTLQSKPLGLRSVTNPLPANGAGDPEKMENARAHAPLTVRTLERIVSRDDYEDFASAFAGIGKAQAVDLWNGEHHLVHLTIAGADGKPVTNAKFLKNFNTALNAVRDPTQQVKVESFDQLLFNLAANVAVDSRYIANDVFATIQSALTDSFSFAQRNFGQPVSAAEVMTIIQQIAGVIYVDLTSLYLASDSQTLNQILSADIAHVANSMIHHAQLLLINTVGITLQEVKA